MMHLQKISGVARICCEEGQSLKLCHGALTEPSAAAAWWLVVLWLMQYWLKELWVVDSCTRRSRRLHNIWIVLSGLLQSKLKWIVGSRGGARASVPHSWRRHCVRIPTYSENRIRVIRLLELWQQLSGKGRSASQWYIILHTHWHEPAVHQCISLNDNFPRVRGMWSPLSGPATG